jgi:hypothetical protein
MMPIDSEHVQDGRERLKGVGGWLMILILGLTFVAPFWQLRIAVHSFETLLSSKPLTQGGILRLSVMVAVYAGLALFSCISGIMLWSSNRRAPEVAKTYLIVSLLAVGVLYSSYRLVGLDLDLSRVLFNRGVYTCFWYAYLVRSRRVRLTYATDHEVTPMPSPSSPEAASP